MSIYYPSEKNALIKLYVPNPERPINFVIEFMNLPENRLSVPMLESIGLALDHIEAQLAKVPKGARGKGGSVITTSTGKFYSNGLLIEDLAKHKNHFDLAFKPTLARFINFGIPTIAAVNGHAFAGGAMLALVHDYVVMNSEKGFICMNEVDLDFHLPVGIIDLVRNKANAPKYVKMMAMGHRFGGIEAEKAGLVDYAVPSSKLLETAIALADNASLKTIGNGNTIRLIKADLNRHVVESMIKGSCEMPDAYLSKL
ncbi:Enoyl-CoA delta isomerase 1, peroxisomal [Smittium mucronatum]|uniref:Enoyl-CoA delta isomerase 1, peroxisomal n=1 Tax=Smittium mucronatum TaxID=133383 RepID=A0A1R0GVL4_9FUNG|nr:Enoyl-CoA delta isomerase 1, peroxisomal [Smittium mucronatum]